MRGDMDKTQAEQLCGNKFVEEFVKEEEGSKYVASMVMMSKEGLEKQMQKLEQDLGEELKRSGTRWRGWKVERLLQDMTELEKKQGEEMGRLEERVARMESGNRREEEGRHSLQARGRRR